MVNDPGNPKIHELTHRLALCTQKDIVVNASTMELRREAVVWTWGRVKSHNGLPSIVALSGYSIFNAMGRSTTPTHTISVRSGIGVEITAMAFIYEEFRKSPPRWYKVLGWSETNAYFVMPVRMVEKSDQALPPLPDNPLIAQPTRVEL